MNALGNTMLYLMEQYSIPYLIYGQSSSTRRERIHEDIFRPLEFMDFRSKMICIYGSI